MVIDLTPLNLGKARIIIKEKITFPNDYLENAELIDLRDVNFDGIIYNENGDYILDGLLSGKMILPCSRSLEPTEYSFEIELEENLENDENNKKIQKTIDILPIIWENILMEIPIRIINPNAKEIKTKGDGWELITDSDN